MERIRLAAAIIFFILPLSFVAHAQADEPCDPLDPICVVGEDDVAPVVPTGVTVTPASVDTSQSAQTLNVVLTATDNLSGIANIQAQFRSPSNTQSVHSQNLTLTSGTIQNGTFSSTLTVPRYAQQGTWNLYTILTTDFAGNHRTYYANELGFTSSFNQTGADDVAPVVPTGVTVTPASVDTSQSAQTLNVVLTATDNLSGIANIQAQFRSPSNTQSVHSQNLTLTSGTIQNGTFSSTLTVPRYAQQGTWNLYTILTTDFAGNHRTYYANELGFTSSFNQTGADDVAPVVPTGVTVTPASVDTSQSAQTLNVVLTATDNLSGIANIQAQFRSPSNTQSVHSQNLTLTSGTIQNGTFSSTLTVPRYAQQGTWNLYTILTTDFAGNHRTYYANELGFTTSIGVNPPKVSCQEPPSTWQSTNISINCTASDAESGLANPADASFNLSTSVPAGSETSNASTGIRQVCNVAGSCVIAGPISGIKVDRKGPSISIDGPLDGAVFQKDDVVVVDFSCVDGGSGVATCVGDAADGDAVDTSTPGIHSFKVTSTDQVGNESVKTVTYTVLPPVPVGQPDLQITKTVDPPIARPGDTLTFTLVAKNAGTATAEDVIVSDPLPAGLTFVSATSPCQFVSGTVTCAIGDLEAGQQKTLLVTVKVDPWGGADSNATHQIDVQKVELQLDLEAGQTRTLEVNCPAGYITADGSVRIDHIDQGTGDWTAPQVLESKAGSLTSWRGTVSNSASGRAQAKLFAVCLKSRTVADGGHQHETMSSGPIDLVETVPEGLSQHVLECGVGEVAIQPGFSADQPGSLVYSRPEGNGWKFVFDANEETNLSFSIRCLKRSVSFEGGHSHDLRLERITTTAVVHPGNVNEAQLTCPDGSKGIVAGWDLDDGLVSIGNDPRPVTRAFKLYNPTSHTLEARLSLLCLANTTAGEHVGGRSFDNTAIIHSPTIESDGDNNSSTVTVPGEDTHTSDPVLVNPNPTKPHPNSPVASTVVGKGVTYSATGVSARIFCSEACSGNAKLVTVASVKSKGKKFGKGTVLASKRYFFGKAGSNRIKLKLTKAGKKILNRSGSTRAKLRISGSSRAVRVR